MIKGTTKRVGVLATEGTLKAGIYREYLQTRYDILEPEAGMLEVVSHGIAEVKAGRVEQARKPFELAAADLRGRGAEAIILACTEIPLAAPAGEDVIDASLALAKACVNWFRHRETLDAA